jgi:NAD(P)-dependent dehydrogenase (short-subunit alcohol dehydrogenase family)
MEVNRMKDYYGYQGKVCVVTGASSGIGYAVSEKLLDLGARVYALDIQNLTLPVHKFINVDLGNRDSIDVAFKEIPDKIDKFFGIAGISGQHHDYNTTVVVNFISNKYIGDKYLTERINEDGSIAFVSSVAGIRWIQHIDDVKDVVDANSWDEAVSALRAKNQSIGPLGYRFSKHAINYYMVKLLWKLRDKKVRVNTIMPVGTVTGLVDDFAKTVGGVENLKKLSGIPGRLAEPRDMADPLIFLGSDMASYISGVALSVDYGAEALIQVGLAKDTKNTPIFE